MAELFETDFKTVFPNLIVFLGPNKNERLFNQLKKSFNEFRYGPIYLQEEKKERGGRLVSTCRIMQQVPEVKCLAKGEGTFPCDAEDQAVTALMEKLCDSCYVIQANPEYFSRKNVPWVALNAEPKQRHIFKVVYLKNNSCGSQFPQSVNGAVDFVKDYNELMKYIEDHGKSDSKADLFILNVLKTDRARIKDQCQKNQLNVQYLVGCSDMGIFAHRNVSTRDILQQLLAANGKTVKYKLIGPRYRFGNRNPTIKGKEATVKNEDLTEEGEGVIINPWISDRLIIMERITQWNELESNKEILFCSVRDCPDTEQFIIEKKRTNTAMILAEAMIDMNVVGRARGYNEKQVKSDAAKDAMKNLTNCCYYIKVKQSYLGSSSQTPVFLRDPYYSTVTRVYRIANRGEEPGKILNQFRSSPEEDLYFLQDFTDEMKSIIHNRAVNMNFLVRRFGRENVLCVSKHIKPRQLLMELMATPNKENEKYQLIIPPIKIQQHMGETTHSWNKQGIQSNQSFCGGQGTGQQQWNHGGDSQPGTENSAQEQRIPPYQLGCESQGTRKQQWNRGGKEQYSGTESLAEKLNDTPSWVMKFIQSVPVKHVKRRKHIFDPRKIIHPSQMSPTFNSRARVIPVRGKGQAGDIYKRYRFIAPVEDRPQVSTSNTNVERVEQTQSEINNVEPCNTTTETIITPDGSGNRTLNHAPTLSERLEKILSEKKRAVDSRQQANFEKNKHMATDPEDTSLKMDVGSKYNMISTGITLLEQRNDNEPSIADSRSNKRPYDQGVNLSGSTNKFFKFTTNSQRSEQERSSDDFSKNTFNEMFASPEFSSHLSNVYEESTRIKIEKTRINTPQFRRSQEATHDQYSNPLWAGGIKQPYDHRPNTTAGGQHNFSNLFDDVQPQDPSTSPFSFGPPGKWRNDRFFKRSGTNNFSKVQKYGTQRY